MKVKPIQHEMKHKHLQLKCAGNQCSVKNASTCHMIVFLTHLSTSNHRKKAESQWHTDKTVLEN